MYTSGCGAHVMERKRMRKTTQYDCIVSKDLDCDGVHWNPYSWQAGQARFMLEAAAAHYLSEVDIHVVHKEAGCIYYNIRMYWIPFPGVKSVSRTAQAAAAELRTIAVITTGEVLGIYRPVLKLATKQTGGQTAVAGKGKELASRK